MLDVKLLEAVDDTTSEVEAIELPPKVDEVELERVGERKLGDEDCSVLLDEMKGIVLLDEVGPLLAGVLFIAVEEDV